MKRGKDDEKIMGPMFPRLHVNDTDKGGPRAPPRNKMALYEQLSVPSQRFNHGVLPFNPSSTSNMVPPSSSSQGSSLDRNMHFPSRVSSSTSVNLAEKFHTRQLGGASVHAPSTRLEQGRKVRDEDDSMGDVFVNSEKGQQYNKTKNGFDGEKLTPLIRTSPGHQIKLRNVCDKYLNQSSSSGVNLRKEFRDQSQESPKLCLGRECYINPAANLSSREKIDGCAKEADVSPDQDFGEHPASRLSRLHENDSCSPQGLGAGGQPADYGCIDGADSMRDTGEGILPRQRSMSYSDGNHSVPDQTNNDSECGGNRTCGSLQWANGYKSDDVSETSVVDSISDLDISPDDVVGIIGQEHFFKARREIANQQKVFSRQVFELHRLIKVQRLIAGSPHLLHEDVPYLSKPSFEGSSGKKLPLEFILKPLPHAKHKDDSEKPSHNMECSAENAIGRTSLSSVKNGSQHSNYRPFLGNPPPGPVNGDNKIYPWCFHHVPGYQWLMPLMSPSEGLIYKPYPGPGFPGSICGGYGLFGQTPMTGNFMTSASHQGIGIPPGAPSVGHSYFPPYGMPVMNLAVSGSAVEQMNHFAGLGSHADCERLCGGGANVNMQHQSSCNLPNEKKGDISHAMKFQASTDTGLPASSAGSPGERVQRIEANSAAEGKNEPPLIRTAPTIPEVASQPCDKDQRTGVIRVVPHNPRSATESAARIFRSIQKERKQM